MLRKLAQAIHVAFLNFRDRKKIRAFREQFSRPLPRFEPSALLPTMFDCPCCGYPTLSERATYEICDLCGWEDDGGDGSGGFSPNGRYSLSAARENFRQHLSMYSPDDERGRDAPEAVEAKRRIMALFEKLRAGVPEGEREALLESTGDQYRILARRRRRP